MPGSVRLVAVLALVLAACSSSGDDPRARRQETPDPTTPPPAPSSVPPVTPADACVPAEAIHFDTFQGGSLSFSEASPEVIESLRDAIPPLDSPTYEDADDAAGYLAPDDLVLGYADGGEAFAYPVKIMNFHEIVNEVVDGRPVLISWCPLCGSGIVFARELGRRVLTFGNTSALFESDLVMYDHQTGSYWHQVAGRGIVGEHCERTLEPLPSLTTTWAQWVRAHPETMVLSRETGFDRPYEQDAFGPGYIAALNDGRFPFPVSDAVEDPRLLAGETVLAVETRGARRAYPLERLGMAAVNDRLGGRPIVVLSEADGPSGGAYLARVGGRRLTFRAKGARFVDRQTGSIWTLGGSAVRGPLEGSRLRPLPVRTSFWFAVAASFPAIEVHGRPG